MKKERMKIADIFYEPQVCNINKYILSINNNINRNIYSGIHQTHLH